VTPATPEPLVVREIANLGVVEESGQQFQPLGTPPRFVTTAADAVQQFQLVTVAGVPVASHRTACRDGGPRAGPTE
jgi:hypothetical protein